jgi:AraC-like DNA-binding protein
MPTVRHLRFDTQTYPDPLARAEAWHDAFAPSAVPVLTPEQTRTLSGRLDLHPLGPVVLVQIAASPQTLVRDRALLSRLTYDHLIFDLFLEGSARGHAGGRPLAIEAGDCVMFDLKRTMHLRISAFRLQALILPRRRLATRVGALGAVDGLMFPAGSPEARLLSATLSELVAQAPRLTEAGGAALGLGVAGVIAACVAARTADEAMGGAGRPAADANAVQLRRHLERHAMDPAFDPARLAAEFGLSRAGLYRAFRSKGGVAAAIRRWRADRAVRLLRDPAWSGRSVEAVARASGFTDARVLRRALRDLHGMTSAQMRPGLLRDGHPISGADIRQEIEMLLERL